MVTISDCFHVINLLCFVMKLAGMICKLDRFLENWQIVQCNLQIGWPIYQLADWTEHIIYILYIFFKMVRLVKLFGFIDHVTQGQARVGAFYQTYPQWCTPVISFKPSNVLQASCSQKPIPESQG